MNNEDIKKLIEEAPSECPITGLLKCESYTIDGNVVYLTNPAYDTYTLPEFHTEDKSFSRIKYDMDDDNRIEFEHLCELDDLRDREDFENIKQFYGIVED